MEDLKTLVFSTPLQLTLDYLLQNSDLELNDTQLTTEVLGAKRAAIHQSLLTLNQCGIIHRHNEGRRCINKLNQDLPWIVPLKIVSNILNLEPFVSKIRDIASKIVLFGSRATGHNRHDSDYDILIISSAHEEIANASMQNALSEKLQLIIKTPEEFLDFDTHEPVLAEHIRKGILLWER